MTNEMAVLLPIILSVLTSIGWGLYHKIRIMKSGQIMDRFNHSVFHKGEKLSYLIIGVALYALAWQHQNSLIILTSVLVLGSLSKLKMGQDIIITEQGVLIRGIFKKWTAVNSVKILDNGNVYVGCKRTSFEITGMEDKESFLSLSKSYISTEWFYATEE